MTVLAATIDRERRVAYMACDRWATGDLVVQNRVSKIKRLGKALVGLSGDPVGKLYLHEAEPLRDLEATEDWMVRLTLGWRAWGKTQGFGEVHQGDYCLPWYVLVATPRGLWTISSTSGLGELYDDYAAQGSGLGPALGAMWRESQVEGWCRKVTAIQGVMAAIAHGEGCGGAVVVERVEEG